MKPDIASLRARWDEASAKAVNQSLLMSGAASSPFGDVEGLIDLRGLPLSVVLKSEAIAMAGLKPIPQQDVPPIRRIDFSFGQFLKGGQLSGVEVEDCRFDGFGTGSNWRRCFRRTSFVRASLKCGQLGGRFSDCDFSYADLSSSRAATGTCFERCVFRQADLRSAIWTQVVFDHCDFSGAKFGRGSLGRARFLGASPTPEQLVDTIMDRAVFE